MAGCRRPSKTSPPWRWAVRSVGVHADGGRPGTRHRDHRCRIVAPGAHVHRVGWRGRRPGTVGAVGVARAQRIRLVRALILGWRAMSMLAAPLCVLSSALAVNAWVKYFSSSATGEHSGAGASLSGGLATPAAANLCLIRSDPARRRFDYIACLCVRRRIRPVVVRMQGPDRVGWERIGVPLNRAQRFAENVPRLRQEPEPRATLWGSKPTPPRESRRARPGRRGYPSVPAGAAVTPRGCR